MATRNTTKKSTTKTNSTSENPDAPATKGSTANGAGSNGDFRIKVRMYRQGLGDCFLLTIPRRSGKPFYIVIDCGVILGTSDATKVMTEVVEHIIATTGGHVDVVAATHEHWDHISGFGQAREIWTDKSRLTIGQVWLSWAEDQNNPLAQKLRGERQALRVALQAAASRMHLAGDSDAAEDLTNLLGFMGAAGTTADALATVKSLAPVRYCTPQDEPVQVPDSDVKVYVLGPPQNEKLIKKYNPSKREPETYGLDAMNNYLNAVQPCLSDMDLDAPFDEGYQIPLHVAQQMPFFQQRYWGEDAASDEKDQGWRRIDGSWLDSSSSLALQLDSATNNTCLVLAFELGNQGDVLLFAADAQVGNWLSWQDVKWNLNGNSVTGPDLLKRTIFYKVGHHGSHNATLRELGLEKMEKLQLAFVPVHQEMAKKKRWNQMPLNDLMDRLNEITHERVVRIDADIPDTLSGSMVPDKLFHEVVL